MMHRAVVVALALVCSPAILHAQDTVLTVSVPSADVYKGPSNVTPVIGHLARGTEVPVLRNLGSWVRVPWPSAPDGIGYVHVTMGRLSSPADVGARPARPAAQGSSASGSASSPSPSPSPAAPQSGMLPRTVPRDRVVVRNQDGSTISHVVGVGGAIGSVRSIGATGRMWAGNRLGVQVGFTRETLKSDASAAHVTSMQIEPALVYGLCDVVGDYLWIRPYVGSGLTVRHQTLHESPAAGERPSDTGLGFRVFGGSELTFAGASRFALSVEAGYRRYSTPFDGFAADRFVASIAGHWYIK